MPKTKISEFDVDPANNTDINSINIAEGCAPSGINNAIRQLMSDLKDWQAGTSGDTLPIAAGGTGATTASAARTALGLAIGTDVQAYDAQLADVAGLTPTDNGVIIGNGTNFVVESGATLKTSLGLTIGTDVQAYDADLTTLALNGFGSSANKIPQFDSSGWLPLGSGWKVKETGGVLYFAVGATNYMKLDASGNLTVAGNITAYGTV